MIDASKSGTSDWAPPRSGIAASLAATSGLGLGAGVAELLEGLEQGFCIGFRSQSFRLPSAVASSAGQNIHGHAPALGDNDVHAPAKEPERQIKSSHGQEGSLGRPTVDQVRRSVLLHKLPRDTTYKDVAEVVQGGALFEITMAPCRTLAKVTFVEPEHARLFMECAKYYPQRIKGQSVC